MGCFDEAWNKTLCKSPLRKNASKKVGKFESNKENITVDISA